ncbi:hypothetical protein [Desulfosediminicola flagellatus]|nr:hypothetical protein [Desulfosediminicola flagellatus]
MAVLTNNKIIVLKILPVKVAFGRPIDGVCRGGNGFEGIQEEA